MVPARLSVVTLAAGSVGELRAFYGRLGWPEVPGSGDRWAGFLLGGAVLALYPEQSLAAEAAPGETAGAWRGVTLAINVDSRAAVDEAYASALDAGARAVAEPQERPWGGRSAYFADPEGNRWEIAYAAVAELGPRGEVVGFG
ncbi:VOC family protein [Saccharopolyspora cebuensis]|uniref:VOC family protein n=1 Tax=Saccharopolyspora cebuensis TaxID=418759 RepID=A0ABV4CRY0_9PSEU